MAEAFAECVSALRRPLGKSSSKQKKEEEKKAQVIDHSTYVWRRVSAAARDVIGSKRYSISVYRLHVCGVYQYGSGQRDVNVGRGFFGVN